MTIGNAPPHFTTVIVANTAAVAAAAAAATGPAATSPSPISQPLLKHHNCCNSCYHHHIPVFHFKSWWSFICPFNTPQTDYVYVWQTYHVYRTAKVGNAISNQDIENIHLS